MAPGSPSVDPHAPPADLDRLIDWFDAFSRRLVLLEECSLGEIRIALGAVSGSVLDHCRLGPLANEARWAKGTGAVELLRLLESEHARFLTSIEELGKIGSIVTGDDHGGNRQALGQYGRAFAESFRRHRADERSLGSQHPDPGPTPASRPASGKRY